MAEHPPLPQELIFDGKPFWESRGGSAVSLLGRSIGLFYYSFERNMLEEGHVVTNAIDNLKEMERRVPNLYEGELGSLVVVGSVTEWEYGQGGDFTRHIPDILRDMGEEPPLIYASFERLGEQQEQLLRERGYEHFVEHSYAPHQVIINAARKVSEVAALQSAQH